MDREGHRSYGLSALYEERRQTGDTLIYTYLSSLLCPGQIILTTHPLIRIVKNKRYFCPLYPPYPTKVIAMNKILTQDEINILLCGLSSGKIEAESDIKIDDSSVVRFDFVNQDYVIRGHMPTLEIINDRYAQLCTNALSSTVHKRVELNPVSIDMTRFEDFMYSLPVPTSINIFKMKPLRGMAIMTIDSRLAFAMVENFFGSSSSQPKIEDRKFTQIEQAIVSRVIKIALDNLEEAWRPVYEVSLKLIRSETNPRLTSIVPPNDIVVVITFGVTLENAIGSLVICLPYSTIKPIHSKLHANFQIERMDTDRTWISRLKKRVLEIPVEFVVYYGRSKITSRQLSKLREGDIILLDTNIDALLEAEVEGVLKYYGTCVTVKGNNAFQIIHEKQIQYT
ncbi:flagellar motor switch protein FliM [Desulfovibrionales bacterium]